MEPGKLYMDISDDGSMRVVFEPVNGNVWLTASEIARLLGCFVGKVTSNIRVLFKSGVLREWECSRRLHYRNGGGMELYNLETVLALAFRIHSPGADAVRKWAMGRVAVEKTKTIPLIILNSGTPVRIN